MSTPSCPKKGAPRATFWMALAYCCFWSDIKSIGGRRRGTAAERDERVLTAVRLLKWSQRSRSPVKIMTSVWHFGFSPAHLLGLVLQFLTSCEDDRWGGVVVGGQHGRNRNGACWRLEGCRVWLLVVAWFQSYENVICYWINGMIQVWFYIDFDRYYRWRYHFK